MITVGGGGGVACARQGDLDTYCLVFLSESVVSTHLGSFLGDGTTLHLRVEIRCLHHTEHDWLELWTDDDYLLSVCWTSECLCKLMIFVNIFLLIVVTTLVSLVGPIVGPLSTIVAPLLRAGVTTTSAPKMPPLSSASPICYPTYHLVKRLWLNHFKTICRQGQQYNNWQMHKDWSCI